MECAGDPELGLDAHDSSLHVIERTGCPSMTVSKPRVSIDEVLRGPVLWPRRSTWR
ncbi:hypothetical protein MOTT12_02251 [Mycobacterium intracellulare subsp. yongonense]|nr:hypothetical protein MOTT12_02251 [Mycobacterium intracellulare subsp. yongonense]